MRVNFSPDSIAEIEGLLDVNRDFCKMKMAKKAPHSAPPNCAVSPEIKQRGCCTTPNKKGQSVKQEMQDALFCCIM